MMARVVRVAHSVPSALRLALTAAVGLGMLAPLAAGAVKARAAPIVMDGRFDDWKGVRVARADPAGDGAADGVDLGRLWLASDSDALYLRFEVGRETLLQNRPTESIGNLLRLYLDLDSKTVTGLPLEGLGVDLEVRFGEREVIAYDEGGVATSLAPGGSGLINLPTHSAETFEVKVPLPATPGAKPGKLKPRKVRLVLREEVDGGDRLPGGGSLRVKTSKKELPATAAIGLERAGDGVLRVMTMNVEDTFGAKPGIHRRYLEAVRPDVIHYQEMTDFTADKAREFVESVLPLPGGRRWEAAQSADCATVSSYPILDSVPIDGNLVAYVDLPAAMTSRDLVVFNLHPPCCDNDAGRDQEIDRVMETWRDLLNGSGPFAIGANDAMVLAGDLNLVGFRRQFEAIRDGHLIGSGESFAPAREAGSLGLAWGRHTHQRTVHTWRRSTSAFVPGKLDFLFFTPDVVTLEKAFVVDTETMAKRYRRRAGFRKADSLNASDHLAEVADLTITP